MLIHFNDLFVTNEAEVLRPKVIIQIDNLVITPKEYPPLNELTIQGLPLQELQEHLLEVDLDYQNVMVFIVKGIAKQ